MSLDEITGTPLGLLIEDWMNQFEFFFQEFGANPYLGRILAIFLLEDKPITQEELTGKLSISKASVSRCVKLLSEKWKIISRTKGDGSRKWHYVKQKNSHITIIWSVINSLLDTFQNQNRALEGILSQVNLLDEKEKQSELGIKLKTILEEMSQSTQMISKELTVVVRNLQTFQ